MTLIYFLVFIFGAAIGSFVNALTYRLPRGISFIGGRSVCHSCGRALKSIDLIPIFSFIRLRGKCRFCRQSIGFRYLLIELYLAVAAVFSFSMFGADSPVFWFFIFPLLSVFLILFVIDLENLILPNSIILAGILVVLGYGFFEKFVSFRIQWNVISFENFLSAFLFSATLFSIWYFSNGRWLGLGDAKLAVLIGLVFGFRGGLVVLYGAFILGALMALLLLFLKRAGLKTKLPLGSFICLSASLYIYGGYDIIEKSAQLDLIFRILK